MQKRNLTRNNIFIMCILLITFIVSMGVVYKNYILPISNEKGYEINVNSSHASNLGELKGDNKIVQTFITNKSFTEVRVGFATYQKVNDGYIEAKLINLDTNEEIQNWNIETQDLQDNSYYSFKLDEKIENTVNTQYELSLDISMENGDYITMLTSDDDVYLAGDLSINGQAKDNDICVILYSSGAGFLRNIFCVAAVFIFILIGIAYYMIFMKNSKIENIFLFSALILGLMYVFLQTPYSNYDEPAHVETSYRLSNKMMGIKDLNDSEGMIYRRAEDTLEGLSNAATKIGTYKTVYDNLFKMAEKPELVEMQARNVQEVKYVYLPSAIGITIGRVLNIGQIPLLILGRMMNLLVFIAAVYYAIKRIPFGKMIIFTSALLPMTLHQAASFSYDGPIIAIAYLFIAYLLRIGFSKETLYRKDYLKFFALLILLAPLKKVYVLMTLLVLIIPKKRFTDNKKYLKFLVLAGIVTICSYILFNIVEAMELVGKTESTSAFSTEPAYTVSIIIHYPIWYLKVLLNSLFNGFIGFLNNGIISIYFVQTSKIITYIFAILLCLSAIKYSEEEEYIDKYRKAIILVLTCGIVVALYTAGFLWTPIGHNLIQGVQGRYLLPVFPVMLLLLRCKKISRPIKTDKLIMFSMIVSQVVTISHVFVKIIFNS